jgi:hypothetical protein
MVLLFLGTAVAQERHEADALTRQLFEQYVARQGKINTASVMAATHLVAERGRETGFWKEVLAELRRGDPNSEIGCVRVLGKMLATDAAARDVIRREKETGESSAWAATVCLGPEVAGELIKRGQKADRFRIDHYVIALMRARTPEARGFFQSILPDPPPADPFAQPPAGARARPPHLDSTKFHAAVGLAQLGDAEGIDWLIANCEFSQGSVMHAWPLGAVRSGSLSACCQEALRQLSGERALAAKAEWSAWSEQVDKKQLRDRVVVFGDP